MNNQDQNQIIKLCACGCGKPVLKLSNKYINGHNVKGLKRSEFTLLKRKCTNLVKFGSEFPLENSDVIDRMRSTNMKRYGVDNVMKHQSAKDKLKETNMYRFGETTNLKCKDTKNKIKQTYLSKYGVQHFNQLPERKRYYRQLQIDRMKKQILSNEPIMPTVSNNGRLCLNEIEQIFKIQIKREVNIICYFVDGLIESKKIVLEFDEKQHYLSDGSLTLRDVNRQIEIENEGYKFFRIKEQDWLNNKNPIIESFKIFFFC